MKISILAVVRLWQPFADSVKHKQANKIENETTNLCNFHAYGNLIVCDKLIREPNRKCKQ